MQQEHTVKYVDLFDDDILVGQTQLYCEALGTVTFVGFSAEADAVVQKGKDEFTSIPELSWNMMDFVTPFQPETHVRYLTQADLDLLHEKKENSLLTLALDDDLEYVYEAVINIKRIYDKDLQ